MLKNIIRNVINELSTEKALLNIHKFYQNDKRFTYSEMIKTPGEIEKQLKEMGLKTEVFKLKSDGKTAYLDCIMPRLWEMYDAHLEITSPKSVARLISDYGDCRLMVPNRCKETPKGGIEAELILADSLKNTGKSAKGKIVLSFDFPGTAKVKAMAEGAVAMVSGFSESFGTVGDGVFWANGWSQSAGWYHSKEEPRLTTFMVSYNEGKRLEKLLKTGKKLTLKGFVKAKTFDGYLKAVSAVIPGTTRQEMLVLGHMYEPFPCDNGDGNAAMLEIARAISKLIKEKKIPVPERSLRFLFSHEKYGSGHYFTDKTRTKRTVAALNADSLCTSLEFSGYKILMMRFSPCALPSIIDVVFNKKADEQCAYPVITERGTYSDDNFMSDPEIGVPSTWLVSSSGPKHHNTVLTFSSCDWKVFRSILNTMTAFVIEMLYLNNSNAAKLLPGYLSTLKKLAEFEYKKLLKRSKSLTQGKLAENLDFIAVWNRQRLENLFKFGISRKLIEKAVAEMADYDRKVKLHWMLNAKTAKVRRYRPELYELESIIPARLTKGMPFSLAKVPFKKRIKNPLEGVTLSNDTDRFFAWIDGKRTLKDCIELYEMDIERELSREELEKTLDYMEYLAKWKYIKLKTR